MNDPFTEIEKVIRSVTEPSRASALAANIEKYFTEHAVLHHPLLKIRGREAIKEIYKTLPAKRVSQKIEFHDVMFNKDKTQITADISEHTKARICSHHGSHASLRLLVRIHLVQEKKIVFIIGRAVRYTSSFMPGTSNESVASMVGVIIGFGIGNLGYFLISIGRFGQ